MKKTKISIIGGAGHIGLPLAVKLAEKNFLVNIIDKNKFALIDFEDAFYGPRQFDQIFFIFNSGKDHWLTLFEEYRLTKLGKQRTAADLKDVMIWFLILKLSKLKKSFFLKYSKFQLRRRIKVIVDFKIMTDKLSKYV